MAQSRTERLEGFAAAFKAGHDALVATPMAPKVVEQAVSRMAHALVDEVKAGGELTFTLGPNGLTVADAPVLHGQALAAPLAKDGVRALTFKEGLPLDEAAAVAQAWVRTSTGPFGTEGVATCVWDQEHAHVAALLYPPARSLGEDALLESERLFRDWTTTPSLPPLETILFSDERAVPTLRALEALELVPEAGVVDIDQWRRDLDALTKALSDARGDPEAHLAKALVRAGDRATTQQEVNALSVVVDRLVARLAHEHHFAAGVDLFRTVSTAESHTTAAAPCWSASARACRRTPSSACWCSR